MEKTATRSDVPRTPINPGMVSAGWFPDVGIYRQGDCYVQSTSRTVYGTAVALWLVAVIVAVSPIHAQALLMPLKWWLSGGIALAGFCCLLNPLMHRQWFSSVLIDPNHRTITYEMDSTLVSWDRILEVQICSGVRETGRHFELNMAWSNDYGRVRRECLLAHCSKTPILRLGRQYEQLFGFRLVDYS